MKFIVCTDGGSRGNPGQAALGVVICDEKGKPLREFGEYLGIKTNNEAEYQAVIFALKKIKALWGKEEAKKSDIKVLADSELLVKHMNKQYKIENEKLQPLFLELWNLQIDFKGVEFIAVPREKNKAADRMVNQALDEKAANKQLL